MSDNCSANRPQAVNGTRIGIDFGGTYTKIAAVSSAGSVICRQRIPTDRQSTPTELLAGLRRTIEHMLAVEGLEWPRGGPIGIGIPANLDHRTGWISLSGALGWRDVPLGELAREAFGCAVRVDDDVAAGVLADLHFGCARDAHDLIYVSWGTGIGAGIVMGRRVYHSRGGAGNELGHMPADPASSRLCYCGCRGCLEVEAGGKAMVEQFTGALVNGERSSLRLTDEITMEHIAAAAESGDALAGRILDRSAVLLARVLAGAIALFNPDTVVFAGGVSRCLTVIQPAFEAELRRRTPGFSLAAVRIVKSAFGDWAGAVGAATLPFSDL